MAPRLMRSTRNKSGYKYVIFDGRSGARSKPWSVSFRKYRSKGFATPREAAEHVAAYCTAQTSPRTSISSASAPVDSWMSKPNVRFSVPDCDLFGRRILMQGRLAVIKLWNPCALAAYGVVFDDQPTKVFMEDLKRPGRKDWSLAEWEDDDIWETSDLRPMCPECGHPLGVGTSAWTKCTACGCMEPGVASTEVLTRCRSGSGDPYRRG